MSPAESEHAGTPLRLLHREGSVESVRHAVHVEGVHVEGLVHRLGRPCKPRENQHTRIVHLRGYVLLPDQIHPVAEGRDDRDVGVAVERGQTLRWNRAVEVADRGPGGRCEAAVDPAHLLVDLPLQVLVLGDLRSTRHGELQQDHPLPMLGVQIEKPLERADPLGDPLGVVEPIHTQRHLLPRGRGGTGRRPRTFLERVEIDPDREHPDLDCPLALLNEPGVMIDAHTEESLDAVEEVPRVSLDLKADQVRREEAAQDLAIPGEDPEEIEGRERDVKEKGDPRLSRELPQMQRSPHEMVVVDPDEVRVARLGGRLREPAVDLLVDLPVPAVEASALREVVEERPDRAVRKSVVVACDFRVREWNTRDPIRIAGRGDLLVGFQPASRPADPGSTPLPKDGVESADQAPARLASLDPARATLDRDRQPIAHDEDRPLARGVALFRGHLLSRRCL
jgi:hypothetical protein